MFNGCFKPLRKFKVHDTYCKFDFESFLVFICILVMVQWRKLELKSLLVILVLVLIWPSQTFPTQGTGELLV